MKAKITALASNGTVTIIIEAENDLESSLMAVYRSQTADVQLTSMWFGASKLQMMARPLYEAQRTVESFPASSQTLDAAVKDPA